MIVIPAKAGIQSLKTFWMPPYQVRGRHLKSGMTAKGVYGWTVINYRDVSR